ncbi:unnamed protein product, partial [Rotaria socialis]
YSVLHNVIVEGKDEENRVDDSNVKLTPYPTLVQLKSSIDDENNDTSSIIEPPSIQPLENFIKKRTITIEGLKQLRIRMAK